MSHVKLTTIVTTAVFLAAAGTVANGWQLYFMAGIVLSLPLASAAIARLSLMNLVVERVLPPHAWVGEDIPITLRIRARDSWPRIGMQVRETVGDYLENVDEHPSVFDIPPRATAEAQYHVKAAKRGVYNLEALEIGAHDPLGLFVLELSQPAYQQLEVLPVPEPLPYVEAMGFDQQQYHDVPYAVVRGSGMDPHGVRQYMPGDPLRRMHWKTVARTGEFHVIEFEEPRAVSVTIVLDCFEGGNHGTGPTSSFELLVRTAASLADMAIRQGSEVCLICTDPTGVAEEPGRGQQHLLAMLSSLARVQPAARTRIGSSLEHVRRQVMPGSTVFVLTGDTDEELVEAVHLLRAQGAFPAVFWADPSAFSGGSLLSDALARLGWHGTADANFKDSLLATQVAMFTVELSERGTLLVEPPADA